MQLIHFKVDEYGGDFYVNPQHIYAAFKYLEDGSQISRGTVLLLPGGGQKVNELLSDVVEKIQSMVSDSNNDERVVSVLSE